jgi:hypothetical protein
MSPDLEAFIAELRAVRLPDRRAAYQAAWDRYIASTEKALRTVDETANTDADTLEKLDEIRAIIRRTSEAAPERLEACHAVLDAIKILSDEKARLAQEQLCKLERE